MRRPSEHQTVPTENLDPALRAFAAAIASGDISSVLKLLSASPELAKARFQAGATRAAAQEFFLDPPGRYIFAGDTALHFAAAAYQVETVRRLLDAGADLQARNRLGEQPLLAAAVGNPGSRTWNPAAQAATIECLIAAGANPNALDKRGVSALHKAVRTRCAAAVQILFEHGALPAMMSKSGSMPLLLALRNTGRGGSGSPEAKAQQQEILSLFIQRGAAQ